RHAFLETKHQTFAVFGCDMLHASGNLFLLLALNRRIKCRKLRGSGNVGWEGIVCQAIEACGPLAAQVVNDQIARDREKPGTEFVATIVLAAAFEHADPSLLEKVLGQLA